METVKDALIRLKDEIKSKSVKLKPGKAEGATSRGGICAASFGSSSLGRAVADNNNKNDWLDKKNRKKRSHPPATPKQIQFAKTLGADLPKNCTKAKAIAVIKKALKRRAKNKEFKKERAKRLRITGRI
jgi:hypothetical protein